MLLKPLLLLLAVLSLPSIGSAQAPECQRDGKTLAEIILEAIGPTEKRDPTPVTRYGRFVPANIALMDQPLRTTLTFKEPFSYYSSTSQRWSVARVGFRGFALQRTVTDGASIPKIFWPIIGSPLGELYRRAAFVHDYYCQFRIGDWRAVHRIFHEAMLANNVDPVLADIMFWAVYRFGPRWSLRRVPISYCIREDAEKVCLEHSHYTRAVPIDNSPNLECIDEHIRDEVGASAKFIKVVRPPLSAIEARADEGHRKAQERQQIAARSVREPDSRPRSERKVRICKTVCKGHGALRRCKKTCRYRN